MDIAAGWQPDPEREDQERYWSGSEWTDRVRPAGKGRSLHLPEHVPELQRALAAATADIDAVEDRLSNLFDRTEGKSRPGPVPAAPPTPEPPPASPADADPDDDEDPIHEEFAGTSDVGGAGEGDAEAEAAAAAAAAAEAEAEAEDDDDGAFAELDAALAAEEPEDSKRRFFRRRS